MTYLLLQTFLLLLSSYFFGAFLACLIKRTLFATRALPAAAIEPAVAEVRPVPVPVRAAVPVPAALKPRTYEPIQPKIDILPRPEPRPAPAPLDTERFDRALAGAQLPDTTPRRMIIEIRPQVLRSVTARGGARDTSLDRPKPAPAPVQQSAPKPATAPNTPAQTSTPVVQRSQAQPAPQPPQQTAQRMPVQPASAPQQSAAQAAAAAAAALAAPKSAAAPAGPVPARPAAPPPSSPPPATSAAPAPRVAGGDDFLRIRAIDEAIAAKLHGIGVRTFEDMARWTPADLNRINQVLGLSGRIEREQWIEQAQILAKGGETYYSRNRAAMLQQQASGAPPPAAAPAPSAPPPAAPALPQGKPAVPPAAAQEAAPPLPVPAPAHPSAGVASAAAAAAAAAAALANKPHPAPLPPTTPLAKPAGPPSPQPAVAAAPVPQVPTPPAPPVSAPPVPVPSVPPAAPAVPTPAAAPVAPSAAAVPPAPPARPAGPPPQPAPAPAAPPAPSAAPVSAAAAAIAQRTPAEMAAAAAAAFAAASASVTRGIKPIEPLSPLSKVDPNILRPARLADAIREKETKEQDGKPREQSAMVPPAATPEVFDDLKRIRGIGVLIEKRLNALGVSTYDQIAKWTAIDVERVSDSLDFKGRIERENWIEQARILATGGQTEFSRRVDKGEVDSSKA